MPSPHRRLRKRQAGKTMGTRAPTPDANPLPSSGKQAGVLGLLAPIQPDLRRVKEIFRRVLFFQPDDSGADNEPPLPEPVSLAAQRFVVPIAEQMGAQLADMEGKWLRASLTLLAARLGGEADDNAVRTAAALELIHVATLIHDDIVDQALVRRGMTALHRLHGETPSVLMGDYLFSKAFYLLTLTGDAEMMRIIARRTNEVCLGEIQESAGIGDLNLSETDYLSLISYKTASLFAACAAAGGRLANLPDAAVEALHRFGTAFGIAFQIRDDILDYVADEAELGKTMLSDLKEGKATLPIIRLRAKLIDTGRGEMWQRLTALTTAEVVDLLRAEGCLESANETCRDYARRAERELDGVAASAADTAPLDTLRQLCRYAGDRRT